jgi:uncharacterized protein (DUF3084 family)
MDVHEELVAVKSENKIYKEHLENLDAEKLGLDQLLVENLKNLLQCRKELILASNKCKRLETEMVTLNNTNATLSEEIKGLNHRLEFLKPKEIEVILDNDMAHPCS